MSRDNATHITATDRSWILTGGAPRRSSRRPGLVFVYPIWWSTVPAILKVGWNGCWSLASACLRRPSSGMAGLTNVRHIIGISTYDRRGCTSRHARQRSRNAAAPCG